MQLSKYKSQIYILLAEILAETVPPEQQHKKESQ